MATVQSERSQRVRRYVIPSGAALTLGLVVAGAIIARPPANPPPPAPPATLPAMLPPPGPVGNEAFVPRAALLPPPESTTGPYPMPPELVGVDLNKQTDGDVAAKSTGCQVCH